jgi:hypothetical protein
VSIFWDVQEYLKKLILGEEIKMGWAKDMLNNKKNAQEQEKKNREAMQKEMENRTKENIEKWKALTVDLICPQINEVVSDLKEFGYTGQIYTPLTSIQGIGPYENVELKIQLQNGPQQLSIRYELVASSGIITIKANRFTEGARQRVVRGGSAHKPNESNLVPSESVELKNFDAVKMESTLKAFVEAMSANKF